MPAGSRILLFRKLLHLHNNQGVQCQKLPSWHVIIYVLVFKKHLHFEDVFDSILREKRLWRRGPAQKVVSRHNSGK